MAGEVQGMSHTSTIYSSLREKSRLRETTRFELTSLSAIEASLSQARAEAELMEEPVIAYFIDMAIAEVNRRSNLQKDGDRRKRDFKAKSVVPLMD